ncbi:ribosomal RNA small subunit methyltransferase E [Holospora obtusa F1]|uniref:Ribosomal RNA small subunit methyltransferase E n=2 Tax=Holospora obtusa TaxID=49893 RepID=W6TFJ8_HOLOB|nr:ribosomal RNA small subunit methyltransferase E [Holospora obtusa F1]
MIRLFVNESLKKGELLLSPQHIHYLYHVMRLKPGDEVEVFNGKDGGWKAACSKKDKILEVMECIVDQPQSPKPLHLYISLFKRLDWALEKSTELGITHIHPVVAQRSSIQRINLERLRRIVQEASEQSKRYTVPEIMPLLSLKKAVLAHGAGWVAHKDPWNTPYNLDKDCSFESLWIGPEGGWSPCELQLFQNQKNLYPLCLSSLCLRTETAVIAGLVVIQSNFEIKQNIIIKQEQN